MSGRAVCVRSPNWLESVHEMADILTGVVFHDDRIPVTGITLAYDVMESFRTQKARLVFLKQLYDIEDSGRASYQAIVTTDVQSDSVQNAPLEGSYELTVHPLDSHPLANDLGLGGTLPIEHADRIDSNITIGLGNVMWKAS